MISETIIKKIIRDNYSTKFSTHSLMGKSSGTYNLTRDIQDKVFSELSKGRTEIGLMEYPQNYSMLRFDIDCKIPYNEGDKLVPLITCEDIINNIKRIQTYLSINIENFKPRYNDSCILTKDPRIEVLKDNTRIIKHGAHFVFPNIFCSKQNFEQLENHFKNIEGFDKISSNRWLLYNCCKKADSGMYEANYIYTHDDKKVDCSSYFKNYSIYNNQEEKIEYTDKIETYYPRIFSINPFGRNTVDFKESLETYKQKDVKKEREKVSADYPREYDPDILLPIVYDLLNLISCDRADDRADWMKIGWALYNIFDGSQDGFTLWDEFSQRSDKYCEDVCEHTWSRMRPGTVNIGTIHFYAKLDNPEEYTKWYKSQNNKVKTSDSSTTRPCLISKTFKEIKNTRKNKRTDEEQRLYEHVINTTLNRQIESLFTLKSNKYVKIKYIPENIKWVEDIVFPKDYRCIGLAAPLGGGKTTSIVRYVQSMPVNYKVLIVSPRVVFSEGICHEYNNKLDSERQFICYTEWRQSGKQMKQLNFKNKVVISMESLWYLESFTPDLLIVDEANANLISHVSPETNGKHLDDNIYTFKRMLKYSKNVIVADAFLASKVTNFFTDINEQLFIYKYKRKLDKRKAIFFNPTDKDVKKAIKQSKKTNEHKDKMLFDVSESMTCIQKLLKDDKKIYAFISTRKDLERLQNAVYDKYNTLFYSGAIDTKIPKNINEEWSKFDMIGTTSKITVGNNFDKKHFDHIFIDYKACSKNYVSDAIQCHYRVRNINTDTIYVSVEDNQIVTNFPVNIKGFQETLDHKQTWYTNKYKLYSPSEIHIQNLILHNYLEHTLSNNASTKMVERYLVECNYDIIKESIKTDIDPRFPKSDDTICDIGCECINCLEEALEDGDIDLVEELWGNLPTQREIIELRNEKIKRKLTEFELSQIGRFFFIQMYTGGCSSGYTIDDFPTVALAYKLWDCKFNGNKSIKSLRLEKMVIEGKITINELAEQRFDETQYTNFQKSDIIQIERVLKVCEKLGLKHCNDTDTIINQNTIEAFYMEAQDEYINIQMDMGIIDQRTHKTEIPSFRQFKGCLESVFTNANHSFCKLKVVERRRERINGKQVWINNYGLVDDPKIVCSKILDINRHLCDKKLNNKKYAKNLYENLRIKNIEEPKRLLRRQLK